MLLLCLLQSAFAAETTDEVGGTSSYANLTSGWAAQFYTATRTTQITGLEVRASSSSGGSLVTAYLWAWDPSTFSYDATSLGSVAATSASMAWLTVPMSTPVTVEAGTTYAVGYIAGSGLYGAFDTGGSPIDTSWGTATGYATGLSRDGGPTDLTTLRTGRGVALRITALAPDADGDGYADEDDCDDGNAAIHPGAREVPYDRVDQDCDGLEDDSDVDGDGHAARSMGGDDCDDARASVNPDATDVWYDGLDADCDGADDFDQDGDGARAASGGGADCDDLDATVFPGAPDAAYDGVDADCLGNDDYDADRDGHRPFTWGGDDCDDADPRRWEDCGGTDTGSTDTGGTDTGGTDTQDSGTLDTAEDTGDDGLVGARRTPKDASGGCSTLVGPPSLALVALGLGALLRRRRAA